MTAALSPTILVLCLVAYVGALLAVAWVAEAWSGTWLSHPAIRIAVYSFSLAIYFTSWTFFGAVGTAASSGWAYLPIFLGPLLLVLFGFGLMRRLVITGRRLQTTSIADFMSTRYGKSEALAGLVAFVCVACALPYIALQLKSISMGMAAMTGAATTSIDNGLTLFVITIGLGVFAILFGTRRLDVSEHNHGMMMAVAIESVVKLAALIFVGMFAVSLVDADRMAAAARTAFATSQFDLSFVVLTALAMAAFLTLPRDFHAMVVECTEPRDLRYTRWILLICFVLTALIVIPVTLAGLALLPGLANADLTMIALPLSQGSTSIAFLAFLGGFSAATSMVIVSTVAVSTMVSNHLIAPTLLRLRGVPSAAMPQLILIVRRGVILALMVSAFLFERAFTSQASLGGLGVLCFALIAQLAPALLAGLYWRRGHHSGAIAGLVVGIAIWFLMLMVPFGIGYPIRSPLFGVPWLDLFTVGAIVSLAANIGLFVAISRRARPTFLDQAQVAQVVGNVSVEGAGEAGPRWRLGDLLELMRQFGGDTAVDAVRGEAAQRTRHALHPRDTVELPVLEQAERQLARLLGSASARILIEHGPHAGLDAHEVASLIGATNEQVRFNRRLMEATIEHIGQGVLVVDHDLRMVAWNSQYETMFSFPAGFLQAGRSVDDVLRLQAERGEMGDPLMEAQICASLEAMRRGRPYTFERTYASGRVLHVAGNPMPGDTYVNSYTDVTEVKRTEAALRDSQARLERLNARLEQRVEERTRELAAAKQQAEAATRGKTRFLAAASHDLMQPINAARLFTSALASDLAREGHSTQALARKIERSIASADRLLRTLLDISKLDGGGLKPEVTPFPLQDLFTELAEEFSVLAGRRGLAIRMVPTKAIVRSDRRLLRSVLQNFLSNAVKYTSTGTILFGARRRGAAIRIDVVDVGPGIAADQLGQIFREFHRVPGRDVADEPSLGLGLAIVDRIASLLGHPLDVASVVGHGSRFSVSVPRAASLGAEPSGQAPAPATQPVRLHGRKLLVIDDDLAQLEAMKLVLEGWGADVETLHWPSGARADVTEPDIIITDYHLARNLTGPTLVERMASRWSGPVPMVIVSADASDLVRRAARKARARIVTKPINAAELSEALQPLTARMAAE